MKNIRDQFETNFSNLGRWIYHHCYWSLFSILALTAVLLLQISQLTIDTSNDAFYQKDDPVRTNYNNFRKRFGKDDHIFIGLKTESVFDKTFLQQLQQLHTELEEKTPYLSRVTSLINARHTYGQDDELIVEDLIPQIPESIDQLLALKTKVLANPFYRNYLLSTDEKFTFIDIEPVAYKKSAIDSEISNEQPKFVSTEEYAQMMDAIQPVLDKYRQLGLEIYVAGFPVVTDSLTRAIEKTTKELTPYSMLFNILFLTLLFRRFSGVYYPCVIVCFTIISTVGIMAWLSIPLDLVTTILPTLLSVVAIADSVHLLSGFYQVYEKNGGNKEEAIAYAMGQNGLAILMTSITTSVGLASFALADLAPVAHLGLIAPIGIMLAFVYTIMLLPALISIFPMRVPKSKIKRQDFTDILLNWIADVSCKHYQRIFITSAFLLIFGIVGALQLQLSHNALTWFPEQSKVRTDTSIIDTALGGSVPIEVVIDTGKEGGVYDPDLISRLENSAQTIKQLSSESVIIGNTNSIHTLLKEVNKALHGNDEFFYKLPNSRELTAQELLLFELSAADDLRKLVTDDYSMVRFTIMVPFTDAIQIKPVLDRVKQHFADNYPEVKIIMTGIGPMLVETMFDVITSMFKSYGVALVIITCLMIFLIGRFKIGLISMVPNLLPIILVMGCMGWFGIPFDFANMMVGSVAIGLVVDDTIHFLHNFNRYLSQVNDVKIAIRETLCSTGRAIFITSMVLISGMLVAMTADLNSTANFGLITACAILFALLADFFLVPAVMFVIYRNKLAIE